MSEAKALPRSLWRVRFCWWCGRKLRGRTFVTQTIEGHERTLHKQCAEMPEIVVRDDEMPRRRKL